MNDVETDLWQTFSRGRDVESRNALVMHYYYLVRLGAKDHLRRFRRKIKTLEELESDATVGLIRAVDRFDTARGVPFTTFARLYISGGINDAARAASWEPRSTRAKRRAWALAAESLGEAATDDTIMARLGLELGERESYRAAVRGGKVVCLTGDETIDIPPSRHADVVDLAAYCLSKLPLQLRRIIYLRYIEGITLTDISARLGISLSSVHHYAAEAVREEYPLIRASTGL